MDKEKTFKPVPDVECLKYHGTPEKPDIKIFVSHRIDLDSETIDNPLYIPVRCGAVYDEREDVAMLGDDTGDNISEKREKYGELSVQYWAWKNVDADYYGLCHYRRYLSFSQEKVNVDFRNQSVLSRLNRKSMEKIGVLDEDKVQACIEQYDLVISEYEDVRKVPTPRELGSTVYEHWRAFRDCLYQDGTLDLLLKILREKYPEYTKYAKAYLSQWNYHGYNCFVMKKDLFFDMCSFQFSILFELEKRLDISYYHEVMTRTFGFMGEILYGIFVYKLECEKYRIKELPLIFFQDTERIEELEPAFKKNNIPIVVMSSKSYVPYLGVFLQSLKESRSGNSNYDVIVLHSEIENKEINKIVTSISNKNISVRFFRPVDLVDADSFHVANSVYAKEAYYRVLTPWILSKYKKIVIMDADIIVNTDIAELFDVDLQGNYACGVKDILWQGLIAKDYQRVGLKKYVEDEFPTKNPYGYINTGVVVVDLEQVRAHIDLTDVIELSQNNNFLYQEQDVMNVLLNGHISFVGPEWNYMVPVNPDVKECVALAPLDYYRQYLNAGEKIKIYHYAAKPKPWEYPEVECGEVFWNVARKSVYYETIIGRMMDVKLGMLHPAVFDLQNRLGVFDSRSGVRKMLDRRFPVGTRRRAVVEKLIPWGSRRRQFCKRVYYFFHPSNKPVV